MPAGSDVSRKVNLRYGFVAQPYACPEAMSLALALQSALGADQVQIGGAKGDIPVHVEIAPANKITRRSSKDQVRTFALCATVTCSPDVMERISPLLDQHEIATIMQRRAELEP